MQISTVERGSPRWTEAQALVAGRYADEFEASATPNPDHYLYAVEGIAEREVMVACAGMTGADTGPLGVERYMPGPVETMIDSALGVVSTRAEIVEVGPLASVAQAAGVDMIRMIAMAVWAMQRKYIVCTTTIELRGLFDRLGYKYAVLSPASESALTSAELARWGDYYTRHPMTCALRVDDLLIAEMNPTRARTRVGGLAFSLTRNEEPSHALA